MKKYSFLIFCFLIGLLPASATVPEEIHGTICDGITSEPIAGVVVQALNTKGKPLTFALSSKNGIFSLKVNSLVDSISFRCMGYKSLKLPATYDFKQSVKMSPQATQLNDVIIEAPDIYARGDTLVFNVSKYANAKDNAIIDVIKRLPGIKVDKDGKIFYQGKPINKFYLDGNDFIGGQYGLATENISHKDVKSVEVMENHQPIKALEGIEFPEEAGINLKLKDDAKGRWVGMAQASTGVTPLLYDGSLFTMRMAKKLQNIFTIRAGNTGWNPTSQIQEHDFNDMFSSEYTQSLWPQYISADMVITPLSEKRTRDNLSWIANAISAWKYGDASMRLTLNYMGDRLDYNSGVTTDYFSVVIPEFIQKNKQRIQTHDLSGQYNMQINKKGYFLKDKLKINAKYDNSLSTITGSYNLEQKVTRKDLSVTNDLKLVKRNEKRLFELTSRNSFNHSPNKLLVKGTDNAVQTVGINDIRSTTESQFGKLSRFWKFYINGGIDLNYHRMNLNLTGMEVYDNSEIYNAFLSNIYASPQLDYNRMNWRISMKASVKWLHHSINGNNDYINFYPRISVHKTLTSKSEFSGSLSYGLASPEAFMNVNVPVMTDYRNLFIGENFNKFSQNIASSLEYRYRNPLNAFFFNAKVGFNGSRSSVVMNQLFIEDFIVSTYSEHLNNCHTLQFQSGLSKGFRHSRMLIGLDMNLSSTSASSMRDNIMTPFRQFVAGAKPYFKGSLTRWFSLNYGANYNYSNLRIKPESTSYHSLNQNLYLTFLPDDRFNFTFGADHYLTRFPEGNTENIILLDASADWRINGKFRLFLKANNLLNKRSYTYITYGTLSRSENFFQIRPIDIILSLQYRF